MATSSTYRTIGAVSGHFPTAAQRRQNTRLASMSVGAQQARDAEAAMHIPTPVYVGICPTCETHQYETYPGEPCVRCAHEAR